MLDRVDLAFAATLERWLLRELNGDDEKTGLYRSILGSQDFNAFLVTKGEIKGYETVLLTMREIARKMNEEVERPQHVMGRPN